MEGNFGFASTLLDTLERHGNTCPRHALQLRAGRACRAASRVPYTASPKLAGEGLFREYSERTGAPVLIYRLPQPLRQVVPPALQLRCGDLLRRRRQRPPLHRQRPLGGAGAALHRRPGRRDAGRAARRGAPLRIRGAGARGGRGVLLPSPGPTSSRWARSSTCWALSATAARRSRCPTFRRAHSPRSSGARSCPTTSQATSPTASGPTPTTEARSPSSCARRSAARCPST